MFPCRQTEGKACGHYGGIDRDWGADSVPLRQVWCQRPGDGKTGKRTTGSKFDHRSSDRSFMVERDVALW